MPCVAAAAGQAHILSWLLKRDRVCWNRRPLALAAKQGVISTVKLLCNGLFVAPDPSLLYIALKQGKRMLAEWLWLGFCEAENYPVLEGTIVLADLLMAMRMSAQARLPISISLDIAARRGDLELLQWAHSNGAVATTAAMDDAAGGGILTL